MLIGSTIDITGRIKSNIPAKIQPAREKDQKIVDDMSGIYKIACSDCPKVYVGQAKLLVTTRFKEHLKEAEVAIKYSQKPTKSLVSKRKVEYGHKISTDDMLVL